MILLMFHSIRKLNCVTLCAFDNAQELSSIRIGNDVFIEINVRILDSVTIGDGTVVQAR